MHELDWIVYKGDCIIGASFTLCGRKLGAGELAGGYRHKYYEEITCPKCRKIYEWLKENNINDYNKFMYEFGERYYNQYAKSYQAYNDFEAGLIDLTKGISSYSKPMQDIIKNPYISLEKIEYLKTSKEVKYFIVDEGTTYGFKYITVDFELAHGDRFHKVFSKYVGTENYIQETNII